MPTFEASTAPPAEIAADLLVLPMFEGGKPGLGVAEVASALGTDLAAAFKSAGLKGETGESLLLSAAGSHEIGASSVLLVGAGNKDEAGPTAVRRAAMKAGSMSFGYRTVASTLPQVGPDAKNSARAFAEGVVLGSYRFDTYKTKPDARKPPRRVRALIGVGSSSKRDAARALERGRISAEAANFTRDLVNTPAADATPEFLAQRGEEIAEDFELDVRIRDKRALQRGGFGGILAVGRGSSNEPRLIELTYRGDGRGRPLAVTGKGITFDSGGLDIKRGDYLEWMKADMAGGAAALATMRAIAEMELPLNVIAAIGSAENMPGADAIRPGDVVTIRGGKTAEITDTDAEGRVLLADVLSYLSEKKPRAIVDSATLTGTGLGEDIWAVIGSDQPLIDGLRAAGDEVGEPGWQLPLWPAYKRHTKSDIADVKNFDWAGMWTDTLSAGVFLKEFAGAIPWAHLDVGDTAYLEAERDEWPKGPTGCPTRVFIRYAENLAAQEAEAAS